MSHLSIHQSDRPSFALLTTSQPDVITRLLADIGVAFRQWPLERSFSGDESSELVLQTWQCQINQLMLDEGYTTADVVSVSPEHPERQALRQKFLAEHTHSENEVRFFVRGGGVFFLHVKGFVYRVICTRGDLISVPANTPHWFDMGQVPDFTAIRLFTDPQGWVAHYTGSDLSHFFASPYEQKKAG